MDRQEIDRIVAEVMKALARDDSAAHTSPGAVPAASAPQLQGPAPRLVTETIVKEAAKAGQTVVRIAPGAIVTPLARDALRELGVSLASQLPTASGAAHAAVVAASPRPARQPRGKVAIGVVPAARPLESIINAALRERGLVPLPVPTPRRDAAHLARQVAGAVSGGEAECGVVIDETGLIGPVVANRAANVIAATCNDPDTARRARERVGANVLCVGSNLVAPPLLSEILSVWLNTPARRPPELDAALHESARA